MPEAQRVRLLLPILLLVGYLGIGNGYSEQAVRPSASKESASVDPNAKLKQQLPIRIDDVDLGYVTVLTSDGKASPETTSGEVPKSGKAGTWKIAGKTLIVKRSFDGNNVDESKYKIGVKDNKLLIGGWESTATLRGNTEITIWQVNIPR
jgi:hypothetical protein